MKESQSRDRSALLARACVYLVFATLVAQVIAHALISLHFWNPVWDDAYLFFRYAENFREGGRWGWNPDGGASFGLTSNLYAVAVMFIRNFVFEDPAWVLWCTSALCGLGFLGAVGHAAAHDPSVESRYRTWGLGALCIGAYLSRENLVAHLSSGMDTTFAMVFLGAWIWLFRLSLHNPRSPLRWLVGCLAGLCYWVRPDILPFVLAPPALVALYAHKPGMRSVGKTITAMGLAGLVLLLIVSALWLGSALPLPFYVKSSGTLGASLLERYDGVAGIETWSFMVDNWLPFVLCLGFARPFLEGRLRAHLDDLGFLLALVVFLAYHAQVALPIMHYEQRFLYPALPVLLLLGARGMQLTCQQLAEHPSFAKYRARVTGNLLALALATGCFAAFLGPTLETWASVPESPTPRLKVHKEWELRFKNYWYGLDEVSAFPDDLVIATTEVGRPGAMNPRKVIVDLGGLNEPLFAKNGFSEDLLFDEYKPDLIYLPHPDYRELIERIQNDPRFGAGYEFLPGKILPIPAVMGVGIRKDSAHFTNLMSVFRSGP